MPKYTIAHSIFCIRGYDQNTGNSQVGQTLVISREHFNKHDKNAVVVKATDTGNIVGRVPKPISEECSIMLDWLDRHNLETKVALLEVPDVLHNDQHSGKCYFENQAKIKIEYLTSAVNPGAKYKRLAKVAEDKWPSIKVLEGSHPTTLFEKHRSEKPKGRGLMFHGIVSRSDGYGPAGAKSSSPTFKLDEKDDEVGASQAWTKPSAKRLADTPRDSDNKWTNKSLDNKRYKAEEN